MKIDEIRRCMPELSDDQTVLSTTYDMRMSDGRSCQVTVNQTVEDYDDAGDDFFTHCDSAAFTAEEEDELVELCRELVND